MKRLIARIFVFAVMVGAACAPPLWAQGQPRVFVEDTTGAFDVLFVDSSGANITGGTTTGHVRIFATINAYPTNTITTATWGGGSTGFTLTENDSTNSPGSYQLNYPATFPNTPGAFDVTLHFNNGTTTSLPVMIRGTVVADPGGACGITGNCIALTDITDETDAIGTRQVAYGQLMLRSDTAIGTDRSTYVDEINNDEGNGGGTFDNQDDSQQAQRDELLAPTTEGRTLDVAATGEAGIDLDNSTGTLDAGEIGADAITAAKIAADAIGSSEIATGAITADEIAADAITAAKIATNAFTSDEAAESLIDEIWDQALAELSQGAPSATPAVRDAIMAMYMALRNEVTVDSSEKTFSNDAGTVIFKKAISDDGSTFTEEEAATGP